MPKKLHLKLDTEQFQLRKSQSLLDQKSRIIWHSVELNSRNPHYSNMFKPYFERVIETDKHTITYVYRSKRCFTSDSIMKTRSFEIVCVCCFYIILCIWTKKRITLHLIQKWFDECDLYYKRPQVDVRWCNITIYAYYVISFAPNTHTQTSPFNI